MQAIEGFTGNFDIESNHSNEQRIFKNIMDIVMIKGHPILDMFNPFETSTFFQSRHLFYTMYIQQYNILIYNTT